MLILSYAKPIYKYAIVACLWIGFFDRGGIYMVIKQILNNNVVVCENENKEEVVVMGRGIAFGFKKGDTVCKDKIEKIFTAGKGYDFDHFVRLIGEIDLVNYEFIEEMINYAKLKLGKKLNNSIYITCFGILKDYIKKSLI